MKPSYSLMLILICAILALGACNKGIDLFNGYKVDRIEVNKFQFSKSENEFKIIPIEITDPNEITKIVSSLSEMRDFWDTPIYSASPMGQLLNATFFMRDQPVFAVTVHKDSLVAKIISPKEKPPAVRDITEAESIKIIDAFAVRGKNDL